jgi:hypothetical protein
MDPRPGASSVTSTSPVASSGAAKPEPGWPDISKPDTRGGGGGTQKK